MSKKCIKIGGASAGFIDSAIAIPQLLQEDIHYLAFDCMGEGVMPLLAERMAAQSGTPYMSEFVEHIRRNLPAIMHKGVKVVANAGGLDAKECALALEEVARELGVSPSIAYIEGDNIFSRVDELRATGYQDMFSGDSFPEKKITTANAYLGAIPIAAALDKGATIVVTGRVVDSAASLGPLIHEFGWLPQDYDKLSAGTLIGHLLECGAQVTGGVFTDWRDVPDWANIGYPIAECFEDGSAIITKPAGTGGLVSVGTVSEQLLYEVSDPQRYYMPDVTCDFSQVQLKQIDENRVHVSNAIGYAPTSTYKALLTYENGWRGLASFVISGENAVEKVERVGAALIERTSQMLRLRNQADWRETSVEALGAESSFGANAQPFARDIREVTCRIAADHDEASAAALLVSEHFTAGISMAPGNACIPVGLGVVPLFKLFPILMEKSEFQITVVVDGKAEVVEVPVDDGFVSEAVPPLSAIPAPDDISDATLPLEKLAWVRSGDKGNISNIAVIARRPEYLPYLNAALTSETLVDWYAHLFEEGSAREVRCYQAPAMASLNFTLHQALGGGITASLRFDPMGKALGQQLLRFPVPVSSAMA